MQADKFFSYAAELLKVNPPHATDEPIIARMKKIGIEPGKGFDMASATPAVKKALESAPEAAQQLMKWKIATLARVVNGWSMNTDTMGVYGNYYLKRAIVTQLGLGANLPEDAIYPINLADGAGRPLDGASKYAIHFDKGAAPPVDAFWSITLYDPEGYQVANPLNRFAVSSWMPFKTNPDGSLDLYVQNENPGKDREGNWLPAPNGCVQSDDAALCSQVRGAHRQVEPACGGEVRGLHGPNGPVANGPVESGIGPFGRHWASPASRPTTRCRGPSRRAAPRRDSAGGSSRPPTASAGRTAGSRSRPTSARGRRRARRR